MSAGDDDKTADGMYAVDDNSSNVPSTSTGVTRRPPRGSGTISEKLPNVAQNLARLRECEDYNMALALQEEEFSEHYRQNRTERQIVSSDFQTSVEEQRQALQAYFVKAAEIAERDAELARNLQREIEEEDMRARINQARLDEEFARRLQMEEDTMDYASINAVVGNVDYESTSYGDANLRVLLPVADNKSGGDRSECGSAPPAITSFPNFGNNPLLASHSSPPSIDDSTEPTSVEFLRGSSILADPPSYAECMADTNVYAGLPASRQPPQFTSDQELIDFTCAAPPAHTSRSHETNAYESNQVGANPFLFNAPNTAEELAALRQGEPSRDK